jgi:hypothetical protein
MVLKKIIVGENHVKGTHLTNPELRKKQDPELRKKQDPATRKLHAADDRSGWKRPSGKRQPDAALLQDCQLRFTMLGGEGNASPIRAVALCMNATSWRRGNPEAGVKGINLAKYKRWAQR